MKKIVLFIFVSFGLLGCQSSQENDGTRKVSIPKRKYKNGLEFVSLKDNSLPYTRIILWSAYGSAHESSLKSGALNLASRVFVEGTKKKSKDDIAKAFAALGSAMHISPNRESTTFSAEALSEDSLKLAKLFTEVVLDSKLSNKSILNVKNKLLAEIQRLTDNPSSMAGLGFDQYMYPDHSYGQNSFGTKNTLSKLRKSDVQDSMGDLLVPSRLKLVLVGRWSADAEGHLLQAFADLEKPFTELPQVLAPPRVEGQRVFFNKRGVKQAQVNIGISSVPRNDPSYIALKVGLHVLGGGLEGRLNQELRIKRGLTYGAYAGLDTAHKGGVLSVSGETRHGKIGEFVREAKKLLVAAGKDGITQEELNQAKAVIKGQFPRGIETKEKLINQYLSLEARGVSGEELFNYIPQVSKLKLAQVNKALRENLDPDYFNVFIYGDYRKAKAHLGKEKYDLKRASAIRL